MTLPGVPEPFYWIDAPWGAALRCRALDPVAPHLFGTRQLQLSSAAHVAALASSVEAGRVQQVTQVHGRAHLVVRGGDDALAGNPPEADLIVSNAPGVAVAVRAADCVPLLIADRETGAVAAVTRRLEGHVRQGGARCGERAARRVRRATGEPGGCHRAQHRRVLL